MQWFIAALVVLGIGLLVFRARKDRFGYDEPKNEEDIANAEDWMDSGKGAPWDLNPTDDPVNPREEGRRPGV